MDFPVFYMGTQPVRRRRRALPPTSTNHSIQETECDGDYVAACDYETRDFESINRNFRHHDENLSLFFDSARLQWIKDTTTELKKHVDFLSKMSAWKSVFNQTRAELSELDKDVCKLKELHLSDVRKNPGPTLAQQERHDKLDWYIKWIRYFNGKPEAAQKAFETYRTTSNARDVALRKNLELIERARGMKDFYEMDVDETMLSFSDIPGTDINAIASEWNKMDLRAFIKLELDKF